MTENDVDDSAFYELMQLVFKYLGADRNNRENVIADLCR